MSSGVVIQHNTLSMYTIPLGVMVKVDVTQLKKLHQVFVAQKLYNIPVFTFCRI